MNGDWKQGRILLAYAVTEGCRRAADVATALAMDAKTVSTLSAVMIRHGLLERVTPGCYRLTELGRIAARDPQPAKPGPKGGRTGKDRPRGATPCLRDRFWTLLRKRRKLSVPEALPIICDGDERNPRDNLMEWLNALARAGIVADLGRKHHGPGAPKKWLLLRDPGPTAPRHSHKRRAVYDPNADTWLPLDGGGAA